MTDDDATALADEAIERSWSWRQLAEEFAARALGAFAWRALDMMQRARSEMGPETDPVEEARAAVRAAAAEHRAAQEEEPCLALWGGEVVRDSLAERPRGR